MKKKLLIAGAFCSSVGMFSQMGVNTTNPQATLDVVATPSVTTKADGFIAPRLTGSELKAKDNAYGNSQKGTIIYVTQGLVPGDTTQKTKGVITAGYFYFNGTEWVRFNDLARAPLTVTAFNASGNAEPGISLASSPENKLTFPIVNITADTTIGSWNGANEFTVLKKGVYLISAGIKMENITEFGGSGIHVHGGSQVASSASPASGPIQLSTTTCMILNPGDIIWVGASRNSAVLSGFTAGYRSLNIIFSEIN